MPTLYGQEYTKEELRRRCGQMGQLGGVSRYELQEGFEKGVEICDVRTGNGFRFCVSPSRGMDITFAEHNGRPLCWNSSTGVRHPAYYNETNLGWLHGFYGGLLTTCGLQSYGAPCEDDGESYGLHDRASYLPATHVTVTEEWNGDDEYEIAVEGTMRQTRVFGPNVRWTRRVSTTLGASSLRVQDRIVNEGFTSTPLVILYHCNFGFPVVSENSIIRAPSVHCDPRDDIAAQSAATWDRLEEPQPGLPERCYFHTMQPDENGLVRAEIWNEKLEFGAFMRYPFAQFPYFTQWKTCDAGTYVNGLEPSNAPLTSRADLKEMNALPMLEAGEERSFEVELGVI
nr:TIORF127 protein [uncultured bacterium]